MDRPIYCEASEKGIIVVNECLKNGYKINTLKLQQLLILMHGTMLALYEKPFFSQNVVATPNFLAIEKVTKDLLLYSLGFERHMEELICLLEKEEEIMHNIIENYGNLDSFELRELPILKDLKDVFSKEDNNIIIPNAYIKGCFQFEIDNTCGVMTVPYKKSFVVSPNKTKEFLNHSNNKKYENFIKRSTKRLKDEEGPVLKKVKNPNKK